MDLKPYLNWMKEESPPAVWSRGVALARVGKAEIVSQKEGVAPEIKLKLQTGERLLAFQVTLWPKDEDAYCNCESKIQPCAHVIAAAQILDQGRAEAPQTQENSVKYEWNLDQKSQPWKLTLARTLGGRPFTHSLISLVSGIESGRIAQPMPVTSSVDLKIDDLLERGKQVGARMDWASLLKLVAELPPIPVAGKTNSLQVDLSQHTSKLKVKVGSEITFEKSIPQFIKLAEGLALSEDRVFLQPEDSSIPESVKLSELEKFLSEDLPYFKSKFEVEIEGILPTVEDAELSLTLKMDRLGNESSDRLVVTPLLQYKLPTGQVIRVLDGQLNITGKEQMIPRRDRPQETALIQKLRRELNLALNQSSSFEGTDALNFTQKLSTTSFGVQSSGKEAILESYQNDQTYRPELELHEGKLKLFFLNRKGARVEIADNQLRKLSENLDHPVMDSLKEYGRVPEDFWDEFGAEIMRLASREKLSGLDHAIARSMIAEITQSELTEERTAIQIPTALQGKLRPYQNKGASWILNRYEDSSFFGALLADEMGLGKTVQTIASLQTPALVVVPTSLLTNWKNEITKFRPELSVNLYHGGNRKWNESASVCITSYGVVRQETEKFQSHNWAMLVMDEAHVLRNRETLSAQAIRAIPARFKLALTGTPIQNHLKDLYSLFSVIQPQYFASEDEFMELTEQKKLFQVKTAPFTLRRLKEDVLKDLPPKTQMLHSVELHAEEQREYDLQLASARKEIQEKVVEAGANPVTLFEVLLRARQVCDHRGLFLPEHAKAPSSKLDALTELLSELTENGHSVLVYSQWTKFLDLIEGALDSHETLKNVPSERLDGSTTNRGKVVERFQSGKSPTVFLLSLHAGGVGLNLTRADHVVFCEPWWNPFVELQAEDRVHRMGQEKPVFIHRLITEGSIEEGMLRLQEKKKALQAALTTEDITSLLSP